MENTSNMQDKAELDRQIEELLCKRMNLAKELGRNIPRDPDDLQPVEHLRMDDITVVFQGVEGAYSHQAMRLFFGKRVKNFHVPNFSQAMEAVVNGEADYAVLPVENTTGGAVGDVLDLQMRYPVYAVAEVNLPIQHVLLGLPGTDIRQVTTVYSHPQAIAQCLKFLDLHPQWERIPRSNTAASAQIVVQDGDPTHVAIASDLAGELYGLQILRRGIATNEGNTTRFIVVTSDKVFQRNAGKVSICFECEHETGNLYHILSNIAFNGLNMTKIESRPIPGQNFEYRFFVEFEGNLLDPVVMDALNGIREETSVLRILGNMI